MPALGPQIETPPRTTPRASISAPAPHPTPRAPLPFLGLACAVGVSTIYYNQPLLLEMAHSYGTTAGHAGFVAVATQVGYAFGLLFFVPLGDVLERRALMMRMYAAVAVALLLVALAPNLTLLIAGSALIGLLASVTHIVLPIAPDLVDHASRGRAIGIVMTGLLLGILLARTFAGWVANIHGWRYVFAVAAVINAIFVPLLWRMMPKLPPKQSLSYGSAMRSLWTLFRTQPLLRESCVLGALTFASFSCFWTTLAFLLDSHYRLGPGVAGSFGVVGAAGAMVAPIAGRLADRKGPRWVISIGMSLLAAAYVLVWGEEKLRMATALHIAALVLGVVVLDMGAQMMQVSNQTRIFGLVPSARSRLNTVYMTIYFSGAAVGSALATLAWVHWRWNGVCGLALGLLVLAAMRHLTGERDGAQDGDSPVREDAEATCLEV
jgi:predicted MFS family arabinose efflux permease